MTYSLVVEFKLSGLVSRRTSNGVEVFAVETGRHRQVMTWGSRSCWGPYFPHESFVLTYLPFFLQIPPSFTLPETP